MKKKIFSILLSGLLTAGTIGADTLIIRRVRIQSTSAREPSQLPYYNMQSIAQYDGTDEAKPTLIALDGLVYDVSAGRDQFYAPGKPYHDIAGRDSSALLHIAGGAIIKSKYPVVGRYQL